MREGGQAVPLVVTVTLPEANPLWDVGLDGAGQVPPQRPPPRPSPPVYRPGAPRAGVGVAVGLARRAIIWPPRYALEMCHNMASEVCSQRPYALRVRMLYASDWRAQGRPERRARDVP